MASENPRRPPVLRYALSPQEYELFRHYLIQRFVGDSQRSQAIEARHTPATVQDDYHAATIRSSLRVFIATAAGLKAWDSISTSLSSRGTVQRRASPRTDTKHNSDNLNRSRPKRPLLSSPNFRLALSLSSILLLHRTLHRFFIRLRLRLLTDKASQLCARYPRLFRGFTSRIAPAIGASLAGFALGLYPSDQLRTTITIYTAARALEMLYNAVDRDGYLGSKPWWVGSWMLFPLAQGQLLHAFVFDRDCFPKVRSCSRNHTHQAEIVH